MGTVACSPTGSHGLAFERVGYASPGDSHGCVPADADAVTRPITVSARYALMMLADLLEAARSAAAVNLAGPGRSLPPHPAVTVML